MTATIIYLSEEAVPRTLREYCRNNLNKVSGEAEIIEVRQASWAPRSTQNVLINALTGIHQAKGETIFLAEHDVLYPPDYFSFQPEILTYARPVWFLTKSGYAPWTADGNLPWKGGAYFSPLSTLCGPREDLRDALLERLQSSFSGGYFWVEPGIDPASRWHGKVHIRELEHAVVDVRHHMNVTGKRDNEPEYYAELDYWGDAETLWKKLC